MFTLWSLSGSPTARSLTPPTVTPSGSPAAVSGSTRTYDRNRLIKTVSGATALNHRYDPFRRSTTTDAGAQVVEQNAYDGYDRLVRQQKFDSAGRRCLPSCTRLIRSIG